MRSFPCHCGQPNRATGAGAGEPAGRLRASISSPGKHYVMNTVLSPLGQRVATGIIGVAFIPFQFFFGRYKSACAAADEYPTDEFGSSDCPALGQWTMHPLKFIVLVFVGLSDCPPLSCMAFQPRAYVPSIPAPCALSATTGWLVPAPAHAPASRAHVLSVPRTQRFEPVTAHATAMSGSMPRRPPRFEPVPHPHPVSRRGVATHHPRPRRRPPPCPQPCHVVRSHNKENRSNEGNQGRKAYDE